MTGDLFEILKITNGISHYDRRVLNMSPRTRNLQSRQILKTKPSNQLDFFAIRLIYFLEKLPDQIKNTSSVENFQGTLDDIRKNEKKKNLRRHFANHRMNYLAEFDSYIDIL